ncbi:hypothetical protein VNI00_009414 [Paramarasmius palmivorus]|uniref:Uncharacterized protein n=1 Tax=Paramarasmius palmivorus TaxID=297713 RepID=A0AAW0CQ75_9AGAR
MIRSKMTACKSVGGKLPQKRLNPHCAIQYQPDNDNSSDDSIEISDPVPIVDMQQDKMHRFVQDELQNPRSYCYYSRIKAEDAPNPFLSISGFGFVGIPMNEYLAQGIIPLCKPHTFEGGTPLQDVWELSSTEVKFNSPTWTNWIQNMVSSTLCRTLDIEANEALLEFDRLVLHGPGSSEEKEIRVTSRNDPTTIGFMQFILPSCHTSASEGISYSGQRTDVSLADPEGALTTIVGYYVGTTFEFKPVETGWRLALVYRIRRHNATQLLQIPNASSTAKIIHNLQPWIKTPLQHVPECLGFLLCSDYETSNLLSSDILQGIDKALYNQLEPAVEHLGCIILFARVTYTQQCDITVTIPYHGGVMTSDEICDLMCDVDADELEMDEDPEEHLDVDELFDQDGAELDRSLAELEKANLLGEDITDRDCDVNFEVQERNNGSLTHTWKATVLLIWRGETQPSDNAPSQPPVQAAKRRRIN